MRSRLATLIMAILVPVIGIVVWRALVVYAEPQGIITVPNGNLFRILPDLQSNRYWILNREHGLVLLTENPPGEWSTQTFNIGDVRDITGPDSSGKIYCSFGGNPAGVHVFDTSTYSVVRTLSLDRYPRCMVLSPDETKLYVCVYQWPLLGVRGEHADRFDTLEHRDGGRVLEIDLSTGQVLREATVGSLPETMYYFYSPGNDRILVNTDEILPITDDPPWGIGLGTVTRIDNISVASFSRMTPRIECMYAYSEFTNDFFEWPGNDPLLGQCHIGVGDIYGYEHMRDAIWLIDPVNNTVVDTASLPVPGGGFAGAEHAVVSECNPDEVYVSGGARTLYFTDTILVVDRWNGTLLRSFSTYPYVTDFIYETAGGMLIVTCGGSGRIFIIDPT